MCMRLVRCVSKRESIPEQLEVGKKYWIDDSSEWSDTDGVTYAKVYLEEGKLTCIGNMRTDHFRTVYRYLNHGGSISSYINTHTGFLLKDIINWCMNNQDHQISEKLLLYILNEGLNTKENLEKEFIVNHIPFNEFVKRGEEESYSKYLGYYLHCID